ncbi:MAG: single-stranded-DNA-specific exonuclease RecJ [Clostridia bacterium]|nr:single-stranded-DNA-specific exonuclease RecJ [Clostridia bacterium]
MRKKWEFCSVDREKALSLAQECEIAPFTALLLCSRGVEDVRSVKDFLSPGEALADPFSLKDMDKAVRRVADAVDRGERICVFGDYDADGVTAVSVLFSYLETLGADVYYRIPSRSDGYGLNAAAVEELAEQGVSLIITVDNGITAFDAAERAAELGVSLVVTDHHMPSGDGLPKADAVVDPHREDDDSALECLAGVGVAFKLVCGIERADYDSLLEEYSQYVAVGTVADLVPLIGENRLIVTAGLHAMRSSPLPWIQALAKKAGLNSNKISSNNVAFGIAPRINAAGRMGSADDAVKLLLSDDPEEAAFFAEQLDAQNDLRHAAEKKIIDDAAALIAAHPEYVTDRVIVLSGENWNEGVIGIVASRIVERFMRPVVMITENGDGTAKGSCRGVEGFSMFDALSYCDNILTNFGGHTLAAGLGLKTENIPLLRKKINEYAESHVPAHPTMKISCKLNPAAINIDFLDALEALEPFGMGNKEPIFALCGTTVAEIRPVSSGKHCRVTLRKNTAELAAMMFGSAPDSLSFAVGDRIDVAVLISRNEFNGRVSPSVQIKAFRFTGTDEEALFASYALYQKLDAGDALSEREKAALLPDRSFIARVYRAVCGDGAGKNEEALLQLSNATEPQLGKLLVTLRALCDSGLIVPKGAGYAGVETPTKINLADIPILAELGFVNQ